MIHDLLLGCLNLTTGTSKLQDIVESGASEGLFHPCEKEILVEIIGTIDSLREVARFAHIYGVYDSRKTLYFKGKPADEETFLKDGIYLIALSTGIDDLLTKYYHAMAELEVRFLKNPTFSILIIYQQLHEYQYICYLSNTMLRRIKIQQFHGSALLNYLYSCSHHGDPDISHAVQTCMQPVVNAFLRQLTNWILYARIGDPYNEFFIQPTSDDGKDTSGSSDQDLNSFCAASPNEKNTDDLLSKFSDYDSIWQYEIIYEAAPSFLSVEYVDKVFFVGQTVLIFNVYASISGEKFESICENDDNEGENKGDLSLWNDKEEHFFHKIQSLTDKQIRIRDYEMIIDEVKDHVTRRLLEIAVDKADLVQQLDLIKDFFLLGRGELFYEFIHLVHNCEKDEEDNDTRLALFVRSFEQAANSLGISEELEQFVFRVVNTNDGLEVSTEFGFLQQVSFEYKINWPLQLLFSPKVMDRYNSLFRFLLLIRKLQFDLHAVWLLQNVCAKSKMNINNKDVRLRNYLMFFVDNLQYYMQSDVLDSEFGTLKSIIEEKNDFERIQKAHCIFLANVLSHCFLLAECEDHENITIAKPPLNICHPVYSIIIELCHVVEEFCRTIERGVKDFDYDAKIDNLDERFNYLITDLMDVFIQYKSTSYASPLSQLLLRLDYNHWFSALKHKICNDIEFF